MKWFFIFWFSLWELSGTPGGLNTQNSTSSLRLVPLVLYSQVCLHWASQNSSSIGCFPAFILVPMKCSALVLYPKLSLSVNTLFLQFAGQQFDLQPFLLWPKKRRWFFRVFLFGSEWWILCSFCFKLETGRLHQLLFITELTCEQIHLTMDENLTKW